MEKIVPITRDLPENLEINVGGKGRGLIRLVKAGAKVPDSACIPPETDIREAVKEALRYFNDEPGKEEFAVRSSAAVEDGEEKSYAGQFLSYLRISGEEELCGAVKECRQSGSKARVYAGKETGPIPVIIQRMIDADIAGVLFTCEPVSGSRNHVVVELVRGTAENLLGGEECGERYILDRSGNMVEASAGGEDSKALYEGLLSRLVKEAVHIEGLLKGFQDGGALDFEWAVKSGEIYWLQVRPVTAIGRRGLSSGEEVLFINPGEKPMVEKGETHWTSMNAREAIPEAVTPIQTQYLTDLVRLSFLEAFHLIGVPRGKLDRFNPAAIFEGRAYLNITDLQMVTSLLPFKNPDVLVEQFLTGDSARKPIFKLTPRFLVPLLRLLIKDIALPYNFSRYIRKEILEWAIPSGQDLSSLSNREIVRIMDRLNDFSKAFSLHMLGSMKYMNAYSRVEKLGEKYGFDASALLQGLGTLLFASAAESLRDLAFAAGGCSNHIFYDDFSIRKDWKKKLEDEPSLSEFKSKFAWYMDTYGHLGEGSVNLYKKNWRDEPEKVLMLVADLLRKNEMMDRQQYLNSLREKREVFICSITSKMSFVERVQFAIELHQMHKAAPFRENMKFYAQRRADLFRIYLAEITRRLLLERKLKREDDAFFLTWDELKEISLEEKDLSSYENLIDSRRVQYHVHMGRPCPLHRIEGGESIRLYYAAPPGERREFKGVGASAGSAIGRARVILGLWDAHRLQPGEILVTTTTDPSWTPYFSLASAIVVEVGSLLSHGAVVAREIGIPAVLGIPGIVSAVRDGDTLVVSGSEGSVEIRRPE